MRQRNNAFDLLCGLCILRMVSLHIMQICGHGHDGWWQGVMSWTFFFMSFFFFKAGYFNKSLGGDTKSYIIDRTRRLFVPYICWALIGNVIYFSFMPRMLHLYHNPIEPVHIAQIWDRGEAFGNLPLWFLLSFYVTYIVAHFIDKCGPVRWAIPLFPFISYLCYRLGNPLWFGLDNVFMALYFFWLGRVWHRLMDWMGRRLTIEFSVFLLLFFIIGNLCWHCEYTMSSNRFTGNPVLAVVNITAVLCGLSGLLMALRVPRVRVISYIGEHSMVYFVAHYPMLYFYKFVHLSFSRSIYGRYDDIIILLPVVFCICSLLVPYVEAAPWLSGRYHKHQSKHETPPLPVSDPALPQSDGRGAPG